MRRPPRLRIPALIGLTVVLSLMMAGLAQAFPATTPDNTGMVDFPGAGGSSNAVAVRTIAQFGSVVWVGGRFTEIDDGNGNKVADAANLAAFDSTTGLIAPGVPNQPLITSSVGDPEVYDSSVGPDGNLYFAGNFDSVNGQPRHNVAAVNATTGALVSGFAPIAPSANSVLATASAIYVGTGKVLSFQLNGAATPGFTPPIAIIDGGIRAHTTLPQFRDIQMQGNTLVVPCQCDSLTDSVGTRTVKAVVEIDATTGNWINWRPAGLDDSSAAFGINAVVHPLPGSGALTVYLAAGGSDFTAAYDFTTGIQRFKTDTSGSSQAIAWYQGTIVIGGHFDWSNSPNGGNACGDNAAPNTNCYHTPKLVSMNASTGAVLLNGATPWNPGICCKYNGVWALLTGSDGSTLHVGGEFTQVGGTWSGSGTNWTLMNSKNRQFYARLSGPTSTLVPLTVQKTSLVGATGTVTSTPSGINCDVSCTSSGPTDFAKNATVTLSAAASVGNTFTGWSSADAGFNCPGTTDCTVTMDAARTVVANFAGISYQLSVSKTNLGTGTVSSSPSGIQCGATCATFYAQNAVVTLSATPGPNSAFNGWTGGGCSGTGTCVVTMTAATSVAADFTRTNQTLTVTRSSGTTGNGQGNITSNPSGINCGATCVKSFSVGTVTLTATAGGGSIFNGWTGGGCSGLATTCVVTMDSAKTVNGDFEQAKSVVLTMAGAGGGTVTSAPAGMNCSASCSQPFAVGSTVTFTATPNGTSVFTGWSGTAGCTGSSTCVLVINAGNAPTRAVTATFQPAQLLTVSPAGSGGGTITSDLSGINCGTACSANYLTGTTVTLTAAADASSSTFTGWSGEGCTGTDTCVVTMSQARNVTASFTLVQRALTVHVAGQGSITDTPGPINCAGPFPNSGMCNATYQHGTDVQLVATAAANWSFTGWTGDCAGTDICVVSMTAARDVTATFGRINRTVNVWKSGSGTGLVTSDVAGIACGDDCAEGYNQGDTVVLSAAADAGSTFTGWSGDCTGTGTCSLTIDAAKNVTATFELLHTLNVTEDGSGTGTVTSNVGGISCPATCMAGSLTHNTHVILTATPGPGSAFAGWSNGGCSGTTPSCDVTMDSDKTVNATFQPAETLTLTMGGSGSGTVTSPPNNEINCPSTCAYPFPQGASVSLHAVANGTDIFIGWSSSDPGFACTGVGDCLLSMDQARNVTATFQPTQPLHITRAGQPGGIVTSTPAGINCGAVCDTVFQQGTSVVLHADGGSNAVFSGWSGDVVSCPGSTDCTVTMDQARSVTATFSPILHQLAVTKSGTGTGTVTSLSPNTGISCGATCQFDFQQGTAVVLHAVADAGSTFAGWSDAGCPGTGDCTMTMDVAKSVNAIFNLQGGGTTTLPDNDPLVAYNGWFDVADNAADGGFYRMSNVKNDKATWKSPATTSLTWVTRTGPDQGKASVTIDGVNKGTVDLYTAAPATLNKVYSGLSNAAHTIAIKVLHTKNNASSDFNVRLDAFVVGVTTTQEFDTKITYDTWKSTTQALATDGTYRSATAATATVTVTFTGTSIDWKTTRGKAYGKASVSIDGIPKGTFDMYQVATAWQSVIPFNGLSAGSHTMVIQVLGQKNPSSTSNKVVVDGFIVHA